MSSIVFVYFPNDNPVIQHDAASKFRFWVNMVTLIGSMLGQILFGFAADKWGRAKFYGYELAILLVSTIGVSMSSYGVLPATQSEFRSSMSVHGWFYFWRLVAGIGVGAEYPLTAVLAAEYALTSKSFLIQRAIVTN
jgi:PHS family inorganic phosphate transporter-like MFS transporter